MNNINWYWLCSNSSFSVLSNNNKELNDCFVQSTFIIPTFLLFITINAYLWGKCEDLPRHCKHRSITSLRLCLLFIFVIQSSVIFIKYFINSSNLRLYSSLMVSDLFQLFAYLIHVFLLFNKNIFLKYSIALFISFILITASSLVSFVNEILKFKDSVNDIQFDKTNGLINVILMGLSNLFLYVYLFLVILNYLVNCCRFSNMTGYTRLENTANEGNSNQIAEEDNASYLSFITFNWLQPVMRRGYRRELNGVEQLSSLPNNMNLRSISTRFIKIFAKDQFDYDDIRNPIISPDILQTRYEGFEHIDYHHISQTENVSKMALIKTILKCFGRKYLILGVYQLVTEVLSFSRPLILYKLVEYIQNKNTDFKVGFGYAGAMVLSTFLAALVTIHFNYSLEKLCIRIKASLVSLIYRKAVVIHINDLNKYTIGEIVNFMSIDSESIVEAFLNFHALWSLPIHIGVTLYLLYEQIGISFLVGLGFIILFMPINKYIIDYIAKVHEKFMSFKDSRVKIMTEFLQGIRVIKFYTWEKYFLSKIDEIRDKELSQLKRKKYLDAFSVYFWACTPVIMSVATFLTYVLLGNQLTPTKVFTSLTLFKMLIMPLNTFPWCLNSMVQAWISSGRLQKFFNMKNLNWLQYYNYDLSNNHLIIDVKNTSFKATMHKKEETKDENKKEEIQPLVNNDESTAAETTEPQFTIRDISFKIERSKLIGVVGKVGCGKTSFLNAILSEITKESGDFRIDKDICANGFAYVSQECWIQAKTIKENILFGKPYDPIKYKAVIEACALTTDLQILPKGDETPVGENGITLSGGQKARLCLARACYQDKQVYLLDDPLSAVDSHVAKHLYDACINGLLALKTRVLCTHHLKYLSNADYVYVIDNGRVIKEGAGPDVVPEYIKLFSVMKPLDGKASENVASNKEIDNSKETDSVNEVKDALEDIEVNKEDEEEREHGVISFKVYKYYCIAIGIPLTVFVLIALAFMQITENGTDLWLSYFMEYYSNSNYNATSQVDSILNLYGHNKLSGYVSNAGSSVIYRKTGVFTSNYGNSFSNETKLFFIVYGSLCVANSFFALVRAFSFAFSCILAAKHIHKNLVTSLAKAPIKFFDTTPRGRILNRLSSDMYALDNSLPFVLNICLACLSLAIGTILVSMYSLPWITVLLIPLGIVYLLIQNYYRWTSREIKRLSSVSLSPIYSHFQETLSGIVTIRSFREIKAFIEHNRNVLETYMRASYANTAAAQWLNLRLQMIGVSMIAVVGFTGVIQNIYGSSNASLVGLALSYILGINDILYFFIYTLTETEKEMVSVERTLQYENLEKENWNGTVQLNDPEWPRQANIRFENVVLRYIQDGQNALDGVNFQINAGEKVGIVGRTGSGKSSLFMALFRAIELNSGKILLDEIDISTVDLGKLRKKMSIIPQDPFLFHGTLRENLDPYKYRTDDELWDTLKKCRLEEKIRSLDQGLESMVEERGKNFSMGEKQLICLARAILSKTNILCIDEATASVDFETDNFIQKTIKEEFKHVTVLTIAHRINTIIDYDKVIVVDTGKIAEFDTVKNLLANKNSKFYGLVHMEQKKISKN